MTKEMGGTEGAGSGDKTALLIAGVWARSKPQVEARLALLDRAAIAAGAGRLDDELRLEAYEVAHKLAGSLGMFGFPLGTEVARKLEMLLGAGEKSGALLGGLVGELRAAVMAGPVG